MDSCVCLIFTTRVDPNLGSTFFKLILFEKSRVKLEFVFLIFTTRVRKHLGNSARFPPRWESCILFYCFFRGTLFSPFSLIIACAWSGSGLSHGSFFFLFPPPFSTLARGVGACCQTVLLLLADLLGVCMYLEVCIRVCI